MKTLVDYLKPLAQYIERSATAIALKSDSAEFHMRLGKLRRQQGR